MLTRGISIVVLVASGCGKKSERKPEAKPLDATALAQPIDAAPPPPIDAPPAPPPWGAAGSCTIKVTGAAKIDQRDGQAVVARRDDAVSINCSGTHVQLTVQPASASTLGTKKKLVIGKDQVNVSGAVDGTPLAAFTGTIDIASFDETGTVATFTLAAKLGTGAVKLTGALDYKCSDCER